MGQYLLAQVYSSGPLMNDRLGLTLRFREFYREQSNIKYRDGGGKEIEAKKEQSPTKANNFSLGTRLNYLVDDYNTLIFDIDFSRNHYDNKKGQLGTLTKPTDKNDSSLTGGYTDAM